MRRGAAAVVAAACAWALACGGDPATGDDAGGDPIDASVDAPACDPDRPRAVAITGVTVGPASGALVTAILESRPHPEQGFRSALGIMRLSRHYGPERLEAAARRALAVRALSYRSVESILRRGLDGRPLPESAPQSKPPTHENIRGSAYYN